MEREQVWRPWDADNDEYAGLLTVRDMIPEHAKPSIENWLLGILTNGGYGYATAKLRNFIETALHTRMTFESGAVKADQLAADILSRGDQFTVRVLDLLLSGMERDSFWNAPSEVDVLSSYLDLSASSVVVISVERSFRIARRLPEGVEQIASDAVSSTGEVAGRHLAEAWRAATAIEPDTSKAMSEAIKAVEAAGGALITPRENLPRLGKIVAALKDQSAWVLAFGTREDGHPDHRAVLIGMLETLVFAQRDRHSGGAPDSVASLGHVQLASTLVAWFSTGVVRRSE